MTYFIQILTGTLGAFGFAILYNLRGTKLLIATPVSYTHLTLPTT